MPMSRASASRPHSNGLTQVRRFWGGPSCGEPASSACPLLCAASSSALWGFVSALPDFGTAGCLLLVLGASAIVGFLLEQYGVPSKFGVNSCHLRGARGYGSVEMEPWAMPAGLPPFAIGRS